VIASLSLLIAADCQPQGSGASSDLKPATCESNAALLDNVKAKFSIEKNESVIILIGRIGRNEESLELNRRRLFNVKHYLDSRLGLEASRIITAQGERTKGYGRVEIYVNGALLETLVAATRKDLCVTCCGSYEDFYPHRGVKTLSSRRR
jgi:hypothetical protein